MTATSELISYWSHNLNVIKAGDENPTSQRALEAMCEQMLAALERTPPGDAGEGDEPNNAGTEIAAKFIEGFDREYRARIAASPIPPSSPRTGVTDKITTLGRAALTSGGKEP